MTIIDFFERNKDYGTLFMRFGLALIFLWFGIDKFIHVQNWIGWVPEWMASFIPVSLFTFMYFQGAIEMLVGALLLVGYKTRFAALLAMLILLGVVLSTIGTGQAEVMLRDIGLLGASISLLFAGSKCSSVDGRRA